VLFRSRSHFPGHDDFASGGPGIPHKSDDGIGSPTSRNAVQELETERFELVEGRKTADLDAIDPDLERFILEAPSLLDEEAKLLKAAAFLVSEDGRIRCLNDDLRLCRGRTNFTSAIAVNSEFASKELIQLCVEQPSFDNATHLRAFLRLH
jgi:hypothetical protein